MADDAGLPTEAPEAAAAVGGEAQAEAWVPTDDSMFHPPGGEEGAEPVRWADYASGMVSKEELTRMRQDDKTRNDTELSTYREQLEASYRTAYQNAVQQLQAQPAPAAAPDARKQAAGEIQALLDHADQNNGGLVNTAIISQLIEKFNTALYGQSDRIDSHERAMSLVYGNQQQGAKSVKALEAQGQGAKLQAKANEIMSTHGIAQEHQGVAMSLIGDIMRAGNGQVDMDRDLPQVFEQRWMGLSKAFHGIHKAEGENAKLVPGKGGDAAPSFPLSDSGLSERDLVDQAWQAAQVAPAQ